MKNIYKVLCTGVLTLSFQVMAQREIYISDSPNSGTGTRENPYNSFRTAVSNAQNGDVIKLLTDVSETYYQQVGSEVLPIEIDKAITFDGQGNTLLIRASPLSLKQDITFKNIKLSMPPLSNLVISTTPVEGENYIYANGNKIFFDGVITRIQGGHEKTRPIIVAGSYKNTADAGRAEIIITNANHEDRAFKAIFVNSLHSDKNTNTKINLASGTRIFNGILTDATYRMSGKTSIISASDRVSNFNLNEGLDNDLELIGISASDYILGGIRNLTLKNSNITFPDYITQFSKLSLDNSSKVRFTSEDYPIEIGVLESFGEIIIPEDSQLIVSDEMTGRMSVDIRCARFCNFRGNEIFVEAPKNTNAQISFTTYPIQDGLIFGQEVRGSNVVWGTVAKNPIENLFHQLDGNQLTLNWEKPWRSIGLSGYEIHRNNTKITTISDIETLSFTENLSNGHYAYDVYAIYGDERSEKVELAIDIAVDTPIIIEENYSGRVGINTETPRATLEISQLDLVPLHQPQGVIFPKFTTEERAKFINITEGTMIYNLTEKCLEIYIGGNWKCL